MRKWLQSSSLLLAHGRARLTQAVDRRTWLAVPVEAYLWFGRHECPMLAAALSYYVLLSLFPLLLILVALASPFLASEEAVAKVTDFTRGFLPGNAGQIRQILQQVLSARGAIEIVAALGFIWSVSGVFELIQRGLNRAWRVATPPAVWQSRLRSLLMVLAILGLFGISLSLSTVAQASLPLGAPRAGPSRLLNLGNLLASAVLGILVFAFIYRWAPHRRLGWRDIWIGAVFSGLAWELSKIVFAWYILNVAHLNLVYGSIGAVIVLLLWGYLSAAIFLYGAELDAARWRRNKEMV